MTTENNVDIFALVPMRHHSERVEHKNYRDFCGKPLFHHILTHLQSVDYVTDIAVDTDSQVISEGIRDHFPDVVLIERPEHLKGGKTSMNEVLLHDVSQLPGSVFLQTHATSPLLRPKTITAAIRKFANSENHDSLFSVTRLQTRLYAEDGQPINHNPDELLRTQDLPPVYEENSALYLFTKDSIQATGQRIGESPLMFPIDPVDGWDIDDMLDFQVAEFLFKQYRST